MNRPLKINLQLFAEDTIPENKEEKIENKSEPVSEIRNAFGLPTKKEEPKKTETEPDDKDVEVKPEEKKPDTVHIHLKPDLVNELNSLEKLIEQVRTGLTREQRVAVLQAERDAVLRGLLLQKGTVALDTILGVRPLQGALLILEVKGKRETKKKK